MFQFLDSATVIQPDISRSMCGKHVKTQTHFFDQVIHLILIVMNLFKISTEMKCSHNPKAYFSLHMVF